MLYCRGLLLDMLFLLCCSSWIFFCLLFWCRVVLTTEDSVSVGESKHLPWLWQKLQPFHFSACIWSSPSDAVILLLSLYVSSLPGEGPYCSAAEYCRKESVRRACVHVKWDHMHSVDLQHALCTSGVLLMPLMGWLRWEEDDPCWQLLHSCFSVMIDTPWNFASSISCFPATVCWVVASISSQLIGHLWLWLESTEHWNFCCQQAMHLIHVTTEGESPHKWPKRTHTVALMQSLQHNWHHAKQWCNHMLASLWSANSDYGS